MGFWKDYSIKKMSESLSNDEMEIEDVLKYEILKIRRAKELSQYELSLLTGITQADISKLENGKSNPTISTLKKIAKVLVKKLVVKFV